MEVALLQHQYDLIDVALHHIRRRRRKRRRREVWGRPWIGRRRQFGLYDQLLVELRQEDQKSFKNFMRMPRQHTLGWGWAAAAAESAGEVAEDEAQFFVEEEEASADVNAGRVAGGTAPYTP